MRGDDVALLQRALRLIGYAEPVDERRDAVFGGSTFEAVSRFQKERGMEVAGVVDAQTALAITVVMEAETVTVQGRVAGHTRAGVGLLHVDIVDIIFQLLWRRDSVHTSCQNRISRCEPLSPSEDPQSTTKSSIQVGPAPPRMKTA
jgi:hypothetical protein